MRGNDRGVLRFFPPQVALYLVKLACELPDTQGRSLCQWDSKELAAQLMQLEWWEVSPQQPSGASYPDIDSSPGDIICGYLPKCHEMLTRAKAIQEIASLYTRPLNPDQMVLCVDEKTSVQPRPRSRQDVACQTWSACKS
ncbi:MAG TPA: hypothetical protein V6D30_07030 [Leptolyngbyaceae cyanobacterium]